MLPSFLPRETLLLRRHLLPFIVLHFLWNTLPLGAQTTPSEPLQEKVVFSNTHFWISTNNVFIFSKRWGILNDIHIRRTNFLKDPSFYFIRLGVQYWISNNLRVAGGYAHLWLADENQKWQRYTNENRIYQQLSFSQRNTWSNLFLRLRTEQRFFNTVENGRSLNDTRLVHRVRFLISLGIPFRKGGRTGFLIANEVLLNFGESIVFNTFDQNRLTLGITYKLSKSWRMDTGYMMVYQQRSSGFEYNLNHTLRLFFYGNFDLRKDKSKKLEVLRQADE